MSLFSILRRNRGRIIPATSPGTGLQLVAVTKLLDEADIVEAFVRHTATHVGCHVLLDNGSRDGTVEILQRLQAEGLNIVLLQNHNATFRESQLNNELYQIATTELGAEWVIYLDADEFIDDRLLEAEKTNFMEVLARQPLDLWYVCLMLTNYVATAHDDPAQLSVPVRMTWCRERSNVEKVIVRGGLLSKNPTIGPGNHQVLMADGRLAPHRHEVRVPLAHYPERSPWQTIVKYVRQWARVEAAGPSMVAAGTNHHCRPTFEILRDRPHDLLRSPWLEGFAGSTDGLTCNPITYRGGPLRYTTPIDEPMRACRSLIGYLEALAREHGRLLEECPAARELCSGWAMSMDLLTSGASGFTAGPPAAMAEKMQVTKAPPADKAGSPPMFATAVHPADDAMLHNLKYFGDASVAEAAYLRQGSWAVDAVRQVAEAWFGGFDRVTRMLEFGPAFGCITRHLSREIPPDQLWCADANVESMRFLQDTFGVRGFVAAASPGAVRCEERFDMIFAPTVFGQLPQDRFEVLLERLLDLLAPGGVLAFATRDELWYPPRQMPADGIVVIPGDAPGRPGLTFVTEHFVRCCIERICGLDWPYRRLARGLYSHYDLYIVGKDENPPALADRLRRGPEGCLEHCRSTAAGFELRGWAGDPDLGHSPPVVEVLLDGQVVASGRPNLQRSDVAATLREPSYVTCGWTAEIAAPSTLSDSPSLEAARLEVRLVADDGRVRSLAMGAVATLLDRRIS